MRDPAFFDGIYDAANRTNEATGRSWHVPEDREPSGFGMALAIIAVIGIALSLIASVA